MKHIPKTVTKKEFQKICGEFAIQERLSESKVDSYTLKCYKSLAKGEAKKTFDFLEKLGLKLIKKDEILGENQQ